MRDVDIAGCVCVVTGANSGIGKEIALGLAARSGTVVAVDRDVCDSLRGEAAQRGIATPIESHVADLSSLGGARAVAETIQLAHSVIHVLVNNAGRHVVRRETSVDGMEMCFALNCLAGYGLARRLRPHYGAVRATSPCRWPSCRRWIRSSA